MDIRQHVLAVLLVVVLMNSSNVSMNDTKQDGTQPDAPTITYEVLEFLFRAPEAGKETVTAINGVVNAYGQAANTGDVRGIREVSTEDWFAYLTWGNESWEDAATPAPEDIRDFEMTVDDVRETPDGLVVAFAERTFVDSAETKTFLVIARPSAGGDLLLDLIFPEVILTDVQPAHPDPMISPDAPYRITAEELNENGLPPRGELIFLPATPEASPKASKRGVS